MYQPAPGALFTINDLINSVKEGNHIGIRIDFESQNIVLLDEDISMDGGVTIRQILNESEDVSLGCASSSELTAYIINSSKLDNLDWTQEFTLSFRFSNVMYGQEGNRSKITLVIPFGYFHGTKPKRIVGQDVIEFVAHDRTTYLDDNADEVMASIQFPTTLNTVLTAFYNHFNNISYFGQGDILSIKPGYSYISAYYNNNPFPPGATYRQIMKWIAEYGGGNLYNNYALNSFLIRWFHDETNTYTLTRNDYFDLEADDDKTTVIDTVRIFSNDENTQAIYPVNVGSEVYDMVGNPLYFSNTGEHFTNQEYIQALYSRLSSFPSYRPTTVEAIGFPCVEVGDIISVEYSDGVFENMPIFARTLTWNGSCTDVYECTGRVHRETDSSDNWTPNIHGGQYDYATHTEYEALNDKVKLLNCETDYTTNADPDNYTTTGCYHVSLASASSPTGSTANGMLVIYSEGTVISQTFICTDNRVYTRSQNSSVWTSWKLLASTVTFGDVSKSIKQNLIDLWTTAVPSNQLPNLARVDAQGGSMYGVISRYSGNNGTAILSKRDGETYQYYLKNGTVTEFPSCVALMFGDQTKTIAQNLTSYWTTEVPNDGKPYPVRIYASNTYYFGMINRYSTNYGSAILQYYNGNSYMFYLINGSVTQRRITPDNEIYWTGTSMSFTSIQGYGYVTNGAQNIYLTFPVRRNFVNQSFTNATVSSFKFSLRGNSGFVDVFSSETTEVVGTSGYTFGASTRNDNSCLYIDITKTSAFTNVTNNTPIHARGNLTITFT